MEPTYEDKILTVLRRKFLVGIPTFSLLGYFSAKLLSSHFQFSKWPRRGMTSLGLVLTPILGSMGIVHFNRVEIFRIGNSMMKQMEQLRKLEQGPFQDAAMREQWDRNMAQRKIQNIFSVDEKIDKEFITGMDYAQIVKDTVSK